MKFVVFALCALAVVPTAQLLTTPSPDSLSVDKRAVICLQEIKPVTCNMGVYYVGHGVCVNTLLGCISKKTFRNYEECHRVCNGLPNDPPCDPPTKSVPSDCRLKKVFRQPGCPDYLVDCPSRQPTSPCPSVPGPGQDRTSYLIRKENGCEERVYGISADM